MFESESFVGAKTYCKDMVNSVRNRLGVDLMKSSALTEQNSFLCSYFQHSNFKNTKEPSSLCNELESMIAIKAWVNVKGGGKIDCNGMLLGGSVFFSQ